MKLIILTVGGQKEDWLLELAGSYQKKLKHFLEFEFVQLRPVGQSRAQLEIKKKLECEKILGFLTPKDWVCLCDERGKQCNSVEFSSQLVKGLERGAARVVIVIAGAYGSSDALIERADKVWSLSKLTFNHLIAQAVVLEQVYRALTIWKGVRYHNE